MMPQPPTPATATPLSSPGAAPAAPQSRPSRGHNLAGAPSRATATVPHGLPADRQARLAARRAFVALKQSFLYVVEGLEGKTELQTRVRQAEEPEELWQLRAPVFAALTGDDAPTRSRRQLLNRSLESMFPTTLSQASWP